MKEYRSSIRSKNMIRQAFIELLAEKDVSKITVVDVVNRADLSRNTFYAHYTDVYAVLTDIENGFIAELNRFLDEAIHNEEIYNPLPLLKRIQAFIEHDIQSNRLLLTNKDAAAFCEKLKGMFMARILNNLDTVNVKDPTGFLIFLECVVGGFIGLYQKSLMGEIDLTLGEITEEINSVFVYGFRRYLG